MMWIAGSLPIGKRLFDIIRLSHLLNRTRKTNELSFSRLNRVRFDLLVDISCGKDLANNIKIEERTIMLEFVNLLQESILKNIGTIVGQASCN